MLAQSCIYLSGGYSLLLMAGCAGSILTGRRVGRRDLEFVRPTGWNQMGRPRKPWPFDAPYATWTARMVKRQFS